MLIAIGLTAVLVERRCGGGIWQPLETGAMVFVRQETVGYAVHGTMDRPIEASRFQRATDLLEAPMPEVRGRRAKTDSSILPPQLPPTSPPPPTKKPTSAPVFENVAVVIVGGTNRTQYARAAHETWLQMFPNRLYVTDTDEPDEFTIPELAAYTHNVFTGVTTIEDQIATYIHAKNPFRRHMGEPNIKKNGNKHNVGWHLAQPRYLLGLQELVKRFPSADWYLVADSDTYVFPQRLYYGLLNQYPAQERALALGAEWVKANGGKAKESMLLGGAGTAISAAAIKQVNISECIWKQNDLIQWNKVGADWRLAKCLGSGDVELKAADFMWMVNQNFTCGEHGPTDCTSFYTRIHRTQTKCSYTLHYMAPSDSHQVYDATERGEVCLPDGEGQCHCSDVSEL
jgi:hypothetical protein